MDKLLDELAGLAVFDQPVIEAAKTIASFGNTLPTLSLTKQVDPSILRLKGILTFIFLYSFLAQHQLKSHRDKLAQILKFNMTMEELKLKMNDCPIAKHRKEALARKFKVLHLQSPKPVVHKPPRKVSSSPKSPSHTVIPFPQRRIQSKCSRKVIQTSLAR